MEQLHNPNGEERKAGFQHHIETSGELGNTEIFNPHVAGRGYLQTQREIREIQERLFDFSKDKVAQGNQKLQKIEEKLRAEDRDKLVELNAKKVELEKLFARNKASIPSEYILQ